jgi:alpha-tubulin suppressor-like RCC1 family protein
VIGLQDGVIAISAGLDISCALLETAEVKCWGSNSFGALGNPSIQVASNVPVPVVGLPDNVVAISSGRFNTCAVTEEGALWCWGRNSRGQLGDGTTIDRATPVPVLGLPAAVVEMEFGGQSACARTIDAGVWCWGDNTNGQVGNGVTSASPVPIPAPVDGLRSVVALGVGGGYACVVTTEARVLCWGRDLLRTTPGEGDVNNLVPTEVEGLGP